MIGLALEGSTHTASLTVFRDGEPVGSAELKQPGRWEHAVSEQTAVLLAAAGCDPKDIDTCFLGRGPGQYTGLRVMAATALGLTLPYGIPVHAVSSGAALLYGRRDQIQPPVAVIGDARRGCCWVGLCGDLSELKQAPVAWQVAAWSALPEVLSEVRAVFSPEPERVVMQLEDAGLAQHDIPPLTEALPTAQDVGRLAQAQIGAGMPSEPQEPIYMHPPV